MDFRDLPGLKSSCLFSIIRGIRENPWLLCIVFEVASNPSAEVQFIQVVSCENYSPGAWLFASPPFLL